MPLAYLSGQALILKPHIQIINLECIVTFSKGLYLQYALSVVCSVPNWWCCCNSMWTLREQNFHIFWTGRVSDLLELFNLRWKAPTAAFESPPSQQGNKKTLSPFCTCKSQILVISVSVSQRMQWRLKEFSWRSYIMQHWFLFILIKHNNRDTWRWGQFKTPLCLSA